MEAINVMDGDSVAYRVRTLNDLKKVISHYDTAVKGKGTGCARDRLRWEGGLFLFPPSVTNKKKQADF